MTFVCATRHVKNARYLQATAPGLISKVEPALGYASRVPFELLGRLHRVKPSELGERPDLAEALRRSPIPPPQARAAGPLFRGSLIFAQISFRTRTGVVAVAAPDLQTAVRYSQLAVVPISRYASQYGPNQATVSPSTVPFAVNVPDGRYNDQTLQGWVKEIVLSAKPPGNSCVVILNPPGIVNTDADPSKGVGGYHGVANVPFCFANVIGSGLTLADPKGVYALALSHEIAEMVVDPEANLANPEICDPCGPNCQTPWIDYFDLGVYLGTSQSFPPPFPYGFFINGIVKPNAATACPAPAAACNYGPP